jgi:catechol 2,3-dioxygenase-like lactoylglutathione lyase family enzyme
MNPRTVTTLESVGTEEVFLTIANIPIQAVLPASDIERARRWYSEKLGLEPVSTSPFGDLRYEAGGVEFIVYQTELAGTNQATANRRSGRIAGSFPLPHGWRAPADTHQTGNPIARKSV